MSSATRTTEVVQHRRVLGWDEKGDENTMTPRRTGPFWDSIEGWRPVRPAAATLGLVTSPLDRSLGS
jgi:hypothetical protein